MEGVVISGYLKDISDNIIPFISGNDVFVHTWTDNDNLRWIIKLQRYEKYTNSLNIILEDPKYDKKLYSYFYSTYTAIRSIPDIDIYDKIVKFKPNLLGDTINYKGNLTDYFYKANIATRPLLSKYKKEDCLYGSVYYKNIDERLFSGYPLAFRKNFLILNDMEAAMYKLDQSLVEKYGHDYEGSIFWTEWFNSTETPVILDLDLNIPNNKM